MVKVQENSVKKYDWKKIILEHAKISAILIILLGVINSLLSYSTHKEWGYLPHLGQSLISVSVLVLFSVTGTLASYKLDENGIRNKYFQFLTTFLVGTGLGLLLLLLFVLNQTGDAPLTLRGSISLFFVQVILTVPHYVKLSHNTSDKNER